MQIQAYSLKWPYEIIQMNLAVQLITLAFLKWVSRTLTAANELNWLHLFNDCNVMHTT